MKKVELSQDYVDQLLHKITAVEYLYHVLWSYRPLTWNDLEKARDMEKKQMELAVTYALENAKWIDGKPHFDFEAYFDEVYMD